MCVILLMLKKKKSVGFFFWGGAELLEICKIIFSSQFSHHGSWEHVEFSEHLRKKVKKLECALKQKFKVLTRTLKIPSEWKDQLISWYIQRNLLSEKLFCTQLYYPEQQATKSSSIIYPPYPHDITSNAHLTEAVRTFGIQAESRARYYTSPCLCLWLPNAHIPLPSC